MKCHHECLEWLDNTTLVVCGVLEQTIQVAVIQISDQCSGLINREDNFVN